MKKLYKRHKPVFFLLIAPVLVVGLFFVFKVKILNIYYSNKYETEISYLKKAADSISENNYGDLKELSTLDSTIINPLAFEKLHEVMKDADVNAVSIRSLTKEEINNVKVVFTDFSFNNISEVIFRAKMVYNSQKWLIDSLYILD